MDLASIAQTISELEAIYLKASSPSFTEDTFPGCTDEYVERMLDCKLGYRCDESCSPGSVMYECKFVRREDGRVVVDRGYNTASISRASMGSRAVQDTQEDGPNHLVMYIQPSGAPSGGVYRADLQVVSRRVQNERLPESFACAETVRQSVVLVPGEKRSAPVAPSRIKEVEAICTYDKPVVQGSTEIMRGGQRTATFLVPDAAYTANPSLAEQAAMQQTRGPGGRAIALDMRHYDLVYERIS